MVCLHREDGKLKSLYDGSKVVCVVCLVENMTDKRKHIAERMEYGQFCLNLLNQPLNKASALSKNIDLFLTAFEALWSNLCIYISFKIFIYWKEMTMPPFS